MAAEWRHDDEDRMPRRPGRGHTSAVAREDACCEASAWGGEGCCGSPRRVGAGAMRGLRGRVSRGGAVIRVFDLDSMRKVKADFNAVITTHAGRYPMLERPDEFDLSLWNVLTSQSPRAEQVCHCDEDHGFAAFDQRFVVLGQSTVSAEPCKGTFHNPALGRHHKATHGVSLHDLDHAEVPAPGPMHERPRVSAIREDHPQSAKTCARLLDQKLGSVAALDVGGMDDQREDQPQRVDDHMRLAARRFLADAVPTAPYFSRLDVWPSSMSTLGVGFLPAFRRTSTRSRS